MRRSFSLLVLVALAGCGKSSVDVRIPWRYDVDAALAEAAATKRPVAVFVGASWDASWMEIAHDTLTDPEVRFTLHRDFVPILVDETDDEDREVQRSLERFKVVGEPTIIVLTPDANSELVRFGEFVKAPRLLAALRTAKEASAARVRR